MKASLKFREDQKPLMRAKIPISILGLPFLSAISAGDSKELRLDLLTAFESGPSLRASYRPSDPSNPFTLSIKTSISCFGSPAGAMTAEFNLLSRNPNPTFTVLFKPKFGDFLFKKSVVSSSAAVKKIADVDGEEPAVWIESPKKEMRPADLVSGALTGVEVSAWSVLPVRSDADVRFRWGVRLPAEMRTAVLSTSNLPSLVLSKISIEHVVADRRVRRGKDVARRAVEVVKACAAVKKQLEEIRAENGALRKMLEEIKGSIPGTASGSKVTAAQGREGDVIRKGRGVLEGSGGRGREKEEKGVNEELKKALMGAAAAGGK